MSRIRSLARHYCVDLLIALLALAAMLELVVGRGSPDGPRTLWFALPAIAILVFPIFARRRVPFAALAAYWLLAMTIANVDSRIIPAAVSLVPVGLTVAFLLGSLRSAAKAAIGLAVVVAGSVVVVYEIAGHSVGELVFIPLEFTISWVAGFALRERAARAEAAEVRASQAERDRETAARIAVAEERARIARELHDIVAHAVSVMVLQVGAVRHRHAEALAEDVDSLRGVEQTGRTALTEMRQLLAAMRGDGDETALAPHPGLDHLEALLQEVGHAGLPVRLCVEGEPFRLPPAIDLSAYRIVQEGLTNALRHARASHADVTVRYRPDEVQLEVRDDGRGGSTTGGRGHGLVGVRERVKIYGGEMTAGPAVEGGFVLSTRLPLNGHRR